MDNYWDTEFTKQVVHTCKVIKQFHLEHHFSPIDTLLGPYLSQGDHTAALILLGDTCSTSLNYPACVSSNLYNTCTRKIEKSQLKIWWKTILEQLSMLDWQNLDFVQLSMLECQTLGFVHVKCSMWSR